MPNSLPYFFRTLGFDSNAMYMKENYFFIVCSGFNCERWVEECARSVMDQTYENFTAIFIDDHSTDKTWKKLSHFCKRHGNKITPLRMTKREGTVMARHKAMQRFSFGDVIVVWLDMDDRLMPNALEKLNQVYQDPQVWMTYGNYITDKGFVGIKEVNIPDKVHEENAYRHHDFMFAHLRSYKKKLYDKLTNEDLFPDPPFNIYPDANMLLCMMEMAGPNHMMPISEPLYQYTTHNPISVAHLFKPEERQVEYDMWRKIKPKDRLDAL